MVGATAQHLVYEHRPPDQKNWDYFGYSVHTRGSWVVVGAPYDKDTQSWSGSAYVYDLVSGLQRREVHPPDPAYGQEFGWSVAVDGNLAVVGAPGDAAGGYDAGAAYVFDVVSGKLLHKLKSPDAGRFNRFGTSVAIAGNRVLVAEPQLSTLVNNKVHVFDTSSGSLVFQLTGSGVFPGDRFGYAVAAHGNHAIVGATQALYGGIRAGAAHLFDLTTGQELHRFLASDRKYLDFFGSAVAIDASHALIGAMGRKSVGLGKTIGAAYMFDLHTGEEVFRVTGPNQLDGTDFGSRVALTGNHALVGAPRHPSPGESRGLVYTFHRTTGVPAGRLSDPSGSPGDYFGAGLAGVSDWALCGAWGKSTTLNKAGALLVYDLNREIGSPYCMAQPNSTGAPGGLYATGSPKTKKNNVTLKAYNLPPGEPGYFLNSQSQGFVFSPGGSQGILCLGGGLGRHTSALATTGVGYVELTLDLSAIPTPNGLASALPGQTWNWQFWHRDHNPGPTSNFSFPVSVLFK